MQKLMSSISPTSAVVSNSSASRPPDKTSIFDPITRFTEGTQKYFKRRALEAEKVRHAEEAKRLEQQMKEIAAMEEELRNLHRRRTSILKGFDNLKFIREAEELRWKKLKEKNDFHLTSERIRSSDCPTPRAFSGRSIMGRSAERDIRYFLDNDVPIAERALKEALVALDKEIEVFEEQPTT